MTEKDLRFKHARQIAGYTQKQLAEAAGVKENLIVRIETSRGTPRDYQTAEKIARLLNRRPYEIGL
jgi:transcriptional regulator with XRE-family HTH domain